ncbi:tRNA uridine-5-carboxymethylaminomethyl(34) synthesis GTPase MnmE [Candidatus Erwinia haradaeae]|uniref:tRNA modification GTPase MnmE n=1 Tax=Candidatus Erwinia haradaeae TaxID=1922217 RepID=A0A451D8N8_9GAMM|nr:tRNA uridine-5-carboxymethylaminomethyl(34) synthesis GTPase MnmE [Candidatus Erwinia haradaeae]VFP82166.1 tRNA modification GTPase MnmE [Candidatus Erwinia haradaeae]
MHHSDTIVAQATAAGYGSVGILRVSGHKSDEVARQVLGTLPRPRYAEYLPFFDLNGRILDQGIALWFPAPYSFTGENVLELQGHGGPVILDLLLKRILLLPGLRIAKPGEFSERAFLNDKLDLTQAEAISDLIHASTEQAARSAVCSLQGGFATRIKDLVESLTRLRMHVETILNFPEEEIDVFSERIKTEFNQIVLHLDLVRKEAHLGNVLREGYRVVIAGRPNVGKSTLFNLLTGHSSAIVTNIAGTTRDVLREHINLNGIPCCVLDTAGLHEASNEIEQIGIERAWQEINKADHVLFVCDATCTTHINPDKIWPDFTDLLKRAPSFTVVRNKVDLTNEKIGIVEKKGYSVLSLSALNREGISDLYAHLKVKIGVVGSMEGSFLARRRHLEALELADTYIKNAYHHLFLEEEQDVLAEDLRLAQEALNEITGVFSSNDLLNRIFSSFCIGK